MSLIGALSIANSGIANLGVDFAVASQNIANASTPGYATEVTSQTSVEAGRAGGAGVRTGATTRQIDQQLEMELLTTNGTVSSLTTQQSALQKIDAIQGTPGGSGDLSALLAQLQSAFVSLQTDPSNQAAQSQVVAAAGQLTGQINALSAAYTQGRQDTQDTIVSGVAQLNSDLATIGSLSDQIVALREQGQSTADLENQRAQTMQSLSQLVSVRFIEQPNGDMLAATSSGMMLPTHFTTPPFATQPATVGPGSSYPATLPAITLNGTDITGQIGGGQLGAAIALRDSTLPTYQAELDEFAQTLSTRFDAQGLTLFSNPNGTIPTSAVPPTQSGYVGYAASIGVNPAVKANPSLVRDGTHAVAGSPGGATAFTPNPSGGPSGFTTAIQRVLAFALGGDVQDGVAQPAPAVAGLGPAGTLAAPFAPPSDLAGFATDIVSTEAGDSAAITAQTTSEQAVQSALQAKVSASGAVNMDTEMSTMLQLQNAYGANAKVITTLQSLWNDVLGMIPS
ncbi:MAG: flagellar hook-associated protein FlgK [Acidisphaera sp.]|nr:flagellar hook-associated protein FlgK [Acidisphaera sp.]